ncbi:hypothetical protein [Helicobacter cetorum]|uniref:hypothetical protein n=1 Tax=Helicobacter cetorum TaxID=138563 RepID=UPI001F2F5946|nr:hypothetical protein [Helicobacter cetorum]
MSSEKTHGFYMKKLRFLSKNACLVLVGVLVECEAHPKDGFFIQAGFETGMTSMSESARKRPLNLNLQKSSKLHKTQGANNYDVPQGVINTESKTTKPSLNNDNNLKKDLNSAENKQSINSNNSNRIGESDTSPTANTPVAQVSSPIAKDDVATKEEECYNRRTGFITCAPLAKKLEPRPPYASINTDNISSKAVVITDSEKQALFKDDNVVGQTFSTTNPIATSFETKDSKIHIKNSLPYDLHSVKLVVKVADNSKQGYKEVELATFDNISASSHITLDTSKIPAFNNADLQGVNTQNFEFRTNASIDAANTDEKQTQRVLDALDKITTNIHGTFVEGNKRRYDCMSSPGCLATPTANEAQGYVNMFLNLASTLDSDEWADAILKANFKFWGHDLDQTMHRDIDKQSIIDQFRQDSRDLKVSIVEYGPSGWAGSKNMAVYARFFDLADNILREENIDKNDPKNHQALHVFFHEFGHTKGWGHKSNFTYNDGYKDWRSDWWNGNGFSRLSAEIFMDLANENKLPIDYKKLSSTATTSTSYQNPTTYYDSNSSYNGSYNNAYDECEPYERSLYNCAAVAPNFSQQPLLNNFSQALNTISATLLESIQTIKNETSKNAMLGFNTQIGYQNYFNNVIGLSYYAMFNYNTSKRKGLLNKTQQYGVGGGINLLIDFINVYAGKDFKSSFGVFAGARGLYNRYQFNGIINASKNKGNVYFTTGLNYRYKHSKFSLGVSMPLIKQSIKAQLITEEVINEVALNENINNMHVFMNYGWVF